MDLANMRSLGVTRSTSIAGVVTKPRLTSPTCPVAWPEIKHWLRCSKWSKRPSETRPDWTQYRAKGKMEYKRT
jgi:hypothetical protein